MAAMSLTPLAAAPGPAEALRSVVMCPRGAPRWVLLTASAGSCGTYLSSLNSQETWEAELTSLVSGASAEIHRD